LDAFPRDAPPDLAHHVPGTELDREKRITPLPITTADAAGAVPSQTGHSTFGLLWLCLGCSGNVVLMLPLLQLLLHLHCRLVADSNLRVKNER